MRPFLCIAASSLVILPPHHPHPSSFSHISITPSSPTTSSIGTSLKTHNQFWPPSSRSRPYGPSFFSPTLPPQLQPSSSRSQPTFSSSPSRSHHIVSLRFTLSLPSRAPPSASSQSGGASGKPTKGVITYGSTNCTRSTVPSSESARTSCLLRMSLQFLPS